MTELDTLVGDEETSSSSSSSETQPYEGHITTSHTSSTSNSNSASQSFPSSWTPLRQQNQLRRRATRQRQQRQLDRALDLLEVAVQENQQLQAQLIQQMQRQQTLSNQHYRALQQQQQLLLHVDECNNHERIPERPAEEKMLDAEKNMAKEESVTVDAETIPTTSYWTTNWNWVGTGLIVATAAALVGGGLILYQVYTATAVEAAKAAATHATLAQRAATRARHEADLSIRSARVAMQAATFRHHHHHHDHHRNFELARDGLASHPYHHYHHHHPWGSMLVPTRWFIHEGSEFERANVCPYHHRDLHHHGVAVNDEMGGPDRVVGGTCGTSTSSNSSSREGTCRRWITPQVVASSVQVGAAAALPVLLALIRF